MDSLHISFRTLPYEMIQVDSVDIENYNEPMEIEEPEVFPDDPFWITHADGEHEDGLEFQYYTHKECWSLAHRQFKMFNYYGGLGIRTFNSVRCMSFVNAVIPAFMGCKEHYFVNWWDRLNMWKPQMVQALQKLFKRPEKKVNEKYGRGRREGGAICVGCSCTCVDESR